MLAFISLVFFLSLAQSLVAAPLGYAAHDAHAGHHVMHRRSCAPKHDTPEEHEHTTTEPTTTTTHHSSTSESAKPTTSAKPPKSNAMNLIWPMSVANAKATWSTSADVAGHEKLSDASLNIYSGKSTPHSYVNAPDGTPAVRAFFEKGSISPGHTPGGLVGGFGMYSRTGVDLTKGKEVLFSYKAFFQDGFGFKKGGKMPGLYGGTSDAVATKCSGGRHQDNACFSSRMMFRADGAGELYAYFPQVASNTKALSSVKGGKVVENDTYGMSVGRGMFKWKTGAWTAITQRLKLNDVGEKNGEFELFVDGESLMNIKGLQFRTSESSVIRGAQIQTFFGGNDPSWASPKDQYVWFKDFSTAILA